tara:strand:- start:394 stop:525 length:132 start_codon:yes stop_codon:yes gene_type:complete
MAELGLLHSPAKGASLTTSGFVGSNPTFTAKISGKVAEAGLLQ